MTYTLLLVFLSTTGITSHQLKFDTANECYLMGRKITEDLKRRREVVSYCIPTKE
jgi:hypothetical protein